MGRHGDCFHQWRAAARDQRSPPGSYLTLDRTWRDGDKIEYRLPYGVASSRSLPSHPSTVSLMYGPLVLPATLVRTALPRTNRRRAGQLDFEQGCPIPPVRLSLRRPGIFWTHIRRVPGASLTFKTDGLLKPADVTLLPFYRLHHERYTVYWDLPAAPSTVSR